MSIKLFKNNNLITLCQHFLFVDFFVISLIYAES